MIRHQQVLAAILAVLAMGIVSAAVLSARTPASTDSGEVADPPPTTAPDLDTPDEDRGPSPEPSPTPAAALGDPWGSVTGLLQFRGNPRHTFYGRGPVPDDLEVAWRYPDRAMCSEEVLATEVQPVTDENGEPVTDAEGNVLTETVPSEVKRWCGTGWTGQPVVWERPDGVTEVVVGAYDGAVHFLDGDTGRPTRPRFQTGFMIKGTVTLDPDGFPLLYTGSRDNRFRVIALDREMPTELWGLDANPRRVWNNDWDGNASIVDDVLYVGGEDSWFYAIELNRGRGPDGLVTVDPQVLVELPGWTDELFEQVGDRNVSIESSVVVDVEHERVYFTNSGGRLAGVDVSRIRDGEAEVVFDYWLGDDADASLVLDHDGMLYAAVEYERKLPRSREVGQLVKLDPFASGDPRVWGVAVPDRPPPGTTDDGGIWSTPALYHGHVYVLTHPGDLLVVDAATGEVTYREDVGYHEWSSPVAVEDPASGRATLVVGLCEGGGLRAYDLEDPAHPTERWTVTTATGACIESTPAVWDGHVWVGSRDGFFYGFG